MLRCGSLSGRIKIWSDANDFGVAATPGGAEVFGAQLGENGAILVLNVDGLDADRRMPK